nr:HNH endonuclease [Actinomycetota bacterium]
MEETLVAGAPSSALLGLGAVASGYLDVVRAGLFNTMTDADLLAELRERELILRRQAAADHALLAEIEARGIPNRLSLPGTSALLQAMLLLSPYEAKQRATAADVCGPRVSATGQPLGPKWPLLAEAQAAGSLSVEQARVIAKTLHRIPLTVAPTEIDTAELSLVHAAGTLRPTQLGQLGERILAYLDPDGVLATETEQQRLRSLALIRQSDGTYLLRGQLTGVCGALLQTLLSAHAAPHPTQDGTPDQRTHAQRMHDALHDLAGFQIRRTELIDAGAPVQLIITMTAEQFHDRDGWAETSFGQLIPAEVALELADEAALTLLIQDARGAVLAEGRGKRIATRAQTLALIARDKGCSFPDCDKPPEWTQRHHMRAWTDGGPTDLTNLCLLRLSHESCLCGVSGWVRGRMGYGGECAWWGLGSASSDAAVGAGLV